MQIQILKKPHTGLRYKFGVALRVLLAQSINSKDTFLSSLFCRMLLEATTISYRHKVEKQKQEQHLEMKTLDYDFSYN